MEKRTRKVLAVMALAGAGSAASVPAPAMAAGWDLSGSLAVQSDYRFRGISQNDRQVTPEASLNLLGPDGWYAGTWLAKTDRNLPRPGGGANPAWEADFYAGKNTELWGGNLNLEACYYGYPDFAAGGGPAISFFETITQFSHAFGPLTATATWAWSPEFSLGGDSGNYLGGTLAWPLDDWVTLSANAGHQWVEAFPGRAGSFTHADLGATLTWRALSLDLRYAATDLGKSACAFYSRAGNACSGGFTATLGYDFTFSF